MNYFNPISVPEICVLRLPRYRLGSRVSSKQSTLEWHLDLKAMIHVFPRIVIGHSRSITLSSQQRGAEKESVSLQASECKTRLCRSNTSCFRSELELMPKPRISGSERRGHTSPSSLLLAHKALKLFRISGPTSI